MSHNFQNLGSHNDETIQLELVRGVFIILSNMHEGNIIYFFIVSWTLLNNISIMHHVNEKDQVPLDSNWCFHHLIKHARR